MPRLLSLSALVLLIASLLCVAHPVRADDKASGNTTDTVAETMRARYASLKSFQASFTQYMTHRESGQTEKREGELLFKKPLLISWNVKSPSPERLIVNAKEIWNYIEDEKLAYRYPQELVNDTRTVIQVLTGQALLSEDFEVEDAGTEGTLRILHLYPREPMPQLVEARLYVDPVKGYIQRAVLLDFYGNENDVRFTSFTPDASISSRVFEFTPPRGVEVEDNVRKPGVQSRDLF